MLKIDTLNQLKQLKQDIKASRNLEVGTVKGSAYKFGFVTLDSGRDVYLPPDQMERVLPGDRVEVEIVKDPKNKKVAKLEKLLESNCKTFCGKYITKGKTHFVEPDINGMTRWFFVPPNKRKDAKMKDLVECKITQHPFKSGKAQAAVIDVIGTEHDEEIETLYAMRKHQLASDWSEPCKKQLSSLNEGIVEELANTRTKHTDLAFITIDSEKTADIDDALYAEKTDEGWTLFIAIADPTAIIDSGSAIEKAAIHRGSSVYFPKKHIGMLPSLISSDLCSLVPNKERLAKVLEIKLAGDGSIVDYTLQNSVIQSRLKAHYKQITEHLDQTATIEDLDENIDRSILALSELCSTLSNKRAESFLKPAERQEFFFEFDEQGKLADIKPRQSTIAHKIVEEAMILANRCVSDLLAKNKLKSVYISHPGVREDRKEALDKVLSESLEQYDAGEIFNFKGFTKHYRALLNSEEQKDLQLLISRQLEKSSFSNVAAPHFGMGLEQYVNFTSPLRKAGDLLIHKQVSSLLSDKQENISEDLLRQIETSIQSIRSASYDVEQWYRCQFIANNEETLNARVLRVFSSGFQVKLCDTGIEGFVSTKDMEEKFSFNQDRLSLSSKTHTLTLDSEVNVKLKHIDWSRKQIQFELIEAN